MWPRRRRERSRVRARLHARRRRRLRRDHASKRGGVRARLPAGRNPRAPGRTPGLRALVLAFHPATRGQHRRRRRAREISRANAEDAPGSSADFVFRGFVARDVVFRGSVTRDRVLSASSSYPPARLRTRRTRARARGILRGVWRRSPTTARTPPRSTPNPSSRAPPTRLDVPREIRNRHRGGRLGGRDGGVHPAGEGRVGMTGVDARARE